MSKKHTLLRKKSKFSSDNATEHYVPDLRLEPIHQVINLKVDIKNKFAEGFVSTKIQAHSNKKRKIVLDAYDLDIKSVESLSKESDISWHYNGKKLSITWEKDFSIKEKREVKINYSVSKPVSGMYFYVPDEKYPNRPELVFIDDEAEKARYWLPSIDHPSVRCTLDFYLTANKEYTILANGKQIYEKEKEDGTKESYWRSDMPCPTYLTTFVIGDLISYQDKSVNLGFGEIPISYYAHKPFKPEHLKISFGRTPEILEWFYNKLKTRIYYPKYFQYVTPHKFGAMENISLVSWDDRFIVNEKHSKEFGREVEITNVHEMAHSWFGNLVGAKEFSHSWLKEAWATYMEAVWMEEKYSKDEYEYTIYEFMKGYFYESNSYYKRPIVTNKYEYGWDMFDGHLYQGGGLRIHMLRKLIGDEVFWNAITDYLDRFKFQAIETIDFQRVLETHSKQNLQKFFDQWVYSPGFPDLKAEFDYDDENKMCKLSIEQQQSEKDSRLFNFDLYIEYEIENGKFSSKTFEIKDKKHEFYFSCDKKPLQIKFDPELKSLFSLEFNPGKDMLEKQAKESNIINRILAFVELAKEGGSKNFRLISKLYKEEKFWGVRNEIVNSLAESETFEAVEILVDILKNEENPLIIKNIISSLRNKRDELVEKAMLDILENDKYLYEAKASALKVLGSQRNYKYFDYLKNYEIKDDWKNIIYMDIFSAIGELRNKEALEYLIEKVEYGIEDDSVRPAIIYAISNIANHMEKHVKDKAIEILCDLLRKEENEIIVKALIDSVASLNDYSVISVLEMAKTKIEHGEHPNIEKQIGSIIQGQNTKEEVKNLRKELEKLKETNSKLLSRVDKLEALSENKTKK